MTNEPRSRSGLETAADAARHAKAAYRIARGAAVAGLKGAAVAAARETLPLLIKICAAILVAVMLSTAMVFIALPNIFFGYDSSDTAEVVTMTAQAKELGGIYMSLEEFEKTYVDALVTSIADSYSNDEITISEISVDMRFDEDDLLHLIAIASAAYKQDLNVMTPDVLQDLCISRLRHTTSLSPLSEDGKSMRLVIIIDHLDAEELMEKLGFDEQAERWAGALYETLSESDALNTYADYFTSTPPSCGGDSFSGEVERGSGYSNHIDIAAFVDPATKNNIDLAIFVQQAWENQWGYVWGTYGNVLTEALLDYKIEQYPNGVGNHSSYIRDSYLDRRTADCVGLIKGYAWLDTTVGEIVYGSGTMPDMAADMMYRSVQNDGTAGIDYGSLDTMPQTVGLGVWKAGHIGVYIGNGEVIEAMGTKQGVVKTKLADRGWQGWCKLPYISYEGG